jgi:uncharacterized protein (TIGR03437 family)
LRSYHEGFGVAFNGVTAEFSVVSQTQITATVPVGASSGAVVVTTPGGTARASTEFVVPPSPVFTGLFPALGAVGGSVTIAGVGFGGATAVTFNGTPAEL